jgi:hypothetical protein
MAAKKSKGFAHIVSLVFTSIFAPIAVSVVSGSIKHEPPAPRSEARRTVESPARKSGPVVTLLPPIGADEPVRDLYFSGR